MDSSGCTVRLKARTGEEQVAKQVVVIDSLGIGQYHRLCWIEEHRAVPGSDGIAEMPDTAAVGDPWYYTILMVQNMGSEVRRMRLLQNRGRQSGLVERTAKWVKAKEFSIQCLCFCWSIAEAVMGD